MFEKTKINEKEAGVGPFKKRVEFEKTNMRWTEATECKREGTRERERVCYYFAAGTSNSPEGLNLRGSSREREKHLGGIISNCLAVGVIAHGTIP